MVTDLKEVNLSKLAFRFESAITIIKMGKTTMQEVAEIMGFTPGFLSRYKKPQLYSISAANYLSVFETLDQLILEKYNRKWNKESEEYELINTEADAPESPFLYNQKLVGLNDAWQGFSWNKDRTEHFSTQPKEQRLDYYNLFKLRIFNKNNVECLIEKTKMTGTLWLVGERKITIQLKSEARLLVMLAQIPLMEDLSAINDITFAYVDSGSKHVKCGLAIVNRMDYDAAIKARTVTKEDLDGFSQIETAYITGQQCLADEWDF
jgi:hypothetical protein